MKKEKIDSIKNFLKIQFVKLSYKFNELIIKKFGKGEIILVIDTNIWYDRSKELADTLRKPIKVLIPYIVLCELEYLQKKHSDEPQAEKIRKLKGKIAELVKSKNYNYELEKPIKFMNNDNNNNNGHNKSFINDQLIIKCAKKQAELGNIVFLLSNDSLLLAYAYQESKHIPNLYAGRKEELSIFLKNNNLENLANDINNVFDKTLND